MFTLTPAYGRDYKSKEAFLKDFDQNLDFEAVSPTQSGKTSKQDLIKMGIREVRIRYDKLRKVAIVSY